MRNILNTMRKVPKQMYALIAVAAAVVIVPAATLAWGPGRPTYTVAHPADHITFDSITDNPVVGDERQFVGIKDASNTAAGGWQNTVTAQPGHEYLVRIYVHNNAASNLNLVAKNTRVTAALSTATAKSVPITGYISADNAAPKSVYADVNLTSAQNFNIAYEPGTAVLYNNVTGQAGRTVSDSIVNNGGALVGYTANDGNWPGCFQYAGYITFKVKPQFAATPNFTVSKLVSKHGANQWTKSYAAQPGEKVDYLVQYKNTGEVQENNVTVKDTLPTGESYVAGSTLYGTAAKPAGQQASDNVTTTGINIGSYATNGGTWVELSATVPNKDQLACGPQTLTNTASVTTDFGTKSDTANVTVTGNDCQPTTVSACNTQTGVIEQVPQGTENTPPHTTDMSKCQKVPACNTQTGVIEQVLPSQQNVAPHTTDMNKCTMVQVCNTTTGQTVTVSKDQENTAPYTTDFSKCTTPVTPVTPSTPSELPHTGASDIVASLIGAGSLIAAALYYIMSRRALNS